MPQQKDGKKGANPVVFVGIGCLVLIVLIGLGITLGVRFARRAGLGLLKGAIENRTGIKTDVNNGSMTFTDTKTGTKVNVGSNSVPDNFPKDFPLYPGAKVTGSLSGAQAGKANGFWLTLTTPDAQSKVEEFYKTELSKNGWTVGQAMTAESTMTETVTKAPLNGTLAVSGGASGSETQIVIVLGEEGASPTP